jgi:DNA repair exonuclease SbcCD ATPase subunit
MSQTNPPRVVIFAGPNGAGKSTHADAILAALFDNSTPPQARQVAAYSANQLTVTENTTWHKLQKLSQVA